MKEIIIILLGICTLISMVYNPNVEHQCIDQTHLTCDGNCDCDGLGCGEYIIHPKHCMCGFCIEATDSGTRNYIIKENKDSIFIFNEENLLIERFPLIIK